MSDTPLTPTGWWVRTYAGYTIGWLVSRTDDCTTLAPVVTKSGKPFCEVHTFAPGAIIEEGPVMLGRQLSREEYEAHQRNLAQIAREPNPILDDVKFVETGMAARIEKNAERFDGAMERLSKK